MATKQASSSLINPIVIVLFIVAVLLVVSGTYLYMRRSTPKKIVSETAVPTMKPTPTPTPTKLYPDDGVKGTYNISQGKHAGPNITQVVFDPLDAKQGQTLTITVKINHTSAIKTVTGTLEADKGIQQMTFTKIDGTETNGSWQGTTQLTNSVDYSYVVKITASAADGTNTISAAPRTR